VRMSRDAEGNIFMTRLTGCGITVRVLPAKSDSCLAKEIVDAKGVLGHTKIKVFDMAAFKRHVADALKNLQTTDPHRFNRLSTFSFSFGQNAEIDTDCPLWMFVVHFGALDMLGKADVLTELMNSLSVKADERLRKNWLHINYSRGMPDRQSQHL
jgi:hypothetical protein